MCAGLLSNKQDEVSKIKSRRDQKGCKHSIRPVRRYDVGLDKIMSTEEQVTSMQARRGVSRFLFRTIVKRQARHGETAAESA